jgi:hypothetical protein
VVGRLEQAIIAPTSKGRNGALQVANEALRFMREHEALVSTAFAVAAFPIFVQVLTVPSLFRDGA